METKSTQNPPVISGSNVMNYSEEALQQKKLTISSLVEKLNAEMVVGEIINDHEEQRQRNIKEQKDALQQEQDANEAIRREELEAERLAREAEEAAALAEEKAKKKQGRSAGEKSLSATVAGLSQKMKQELYKNETVKRIFNLDDVLELEEEESEESSGIEETEETKTKKELKKKGSKNTFKRKSDSEEEEAFEEDDSEIEEVSEGKTKKVLKKKSDGLKEFAAKFKKNKSQKKSKKTSKSKEAPQTSSGKKIHAAFDDDVIFDEDDIDLPETEEIEEETIIDEPEEDEIESRKPLTRKDMIQEDLSRFHEPISSEEVFRFRTALERLSSDSYRSVFVYAACIIDREFTSLSIIKNVTLLAELIEESGDDMDFYFAYIITNKGVQHFGNDDALSDVTLAMEAIRTLFVQKKGRVVADQIQKLPALRPLFQTIYYEDRR